MLQAEQVIKHNLCFKASLKDVESSCAHFSNLSITLNRKIPFIPAFADTSRKTFLGYFPIAEWKLKIYDSAAFGFRHKLLKIFSLIYGWSIFTRKKRFLEVDNLIFRGKLFTIITLFGNNFQLQQKLKLFLHLNLKNGE